MSKNLNILADTRALLKVKQPSKDFLLKHPYIITTSEAIQDGRFILLLDAGERLLYIDRDEIGALSSFASSLRNSKSKAELKLERKINKIKQSILNDKTHYLEYIDQKYKKWFDVLSSNPIDLKANKQFVFKSITERTSKSFIKEDKLTFSKEDIISIIDNFFEHNVWSDSFEKLVSNDYIRLDNINALKNDDKKHLFNFLENTITIYKLTDVDDKKFSINMKLSSDVNESTVYSKIQLQYTDELLLSAKPDVLHELISLDSFISEDDLHIHNNDIERFIRSRFERTIEDIEIVKNDLLLKESFYPDFFGKLSNVKKISAKVKINIHNEVIDKNTIRNRIIDSILTQIFDVKERRLAGFKRSFNRRIIQKNLEIDNFKNLFPCARERNRKLTYIQGETNSGKTYTAFEKAKQFKSGIYAAPLRLLALEGQQEFLSRGIECSMITGEERDIMNNASFVSSTVEMIDYSKEYDVAIIDEVQLINDPDRGHAWLDAIVGVNAKEVILVGSKDIEPVIKDIAHYLGESLTIETFHRKTKLQFDRDLFRKSMDKNGKLPKHSAVIAFSKSDVLALKTRFEKLGNTVSVIYGALPPQVRRLETERFVNGETEVVIATDAIGMGLNLPIENIFFYKKEKYNGKEIVELDFPLVKQIVGRAGRYQKFDIGYVSALSNSVFDYIHHAFHQDTLVDEKDLKCSPNYPIIKQIHELTKEESVYKLLQNYNNAINFDFEIKNHMNEYAYMIARFLDDNSENVSFEQLSLFEKVKIVNAPISMDRSFKVLDFYKSCIKNIYTLRNDTSIHPISIVYSAFDSISTDSQNKTELSIKKLDLLSWLSFNFEEFACLKDDISEKRKVLNNALIRYLRAAKED